MSNLLTGMQIGKALEEMQKAITEANVTGGNLVREDLQAGLAVAGPMETPLRNRLNRVTGSGNAHSFYVMKPNADKTKGVFYGTVPGNAVFPKGGLPVDAQEAYVQKAIPYANLGDVARVTFQDQVQGASFIDLYSQRKMVKAKNVCMIEEYFNLNGDSSQVQPGGGFIYDGLIVQISNGGGQLASPSDGKLNIGLIAANQEQIAEAGGQTSVVIMDFLGKAILTRQVNQIYSIHQTASSSLGNISGGVAVNAWDFGFGVVDWMANRYLVPASDGTHFVINLDDKSNDTQNDGNVVQMVDVDPLHSIDLAIVNTSWSSVIYETTMMMVSVPQFQGLVHGLTYAGQDAATG